MSDDIVIRRPTIGFGPIKPAEPEPSPPAEQPYVKVLEADGTPHFFTSAMFSFSQ